ncbi:MAG: PGF-pre-PGF domain-containing protein [Candidatus Thermoplasmatota archaeon]|nr:PGF-pre-PGF domain-containing protein [Candidatus Thermoplasmatota archaeon]
MRKINFNRKLSAGKRAGIQKIFCCYLLTSISISIFTSAFISPVIADSNASKITIPAKIVNITDESSNDDINTSAQSVETTKLESEVSTSDTATPSTADTSQTDTLPSTINTISTSNLPTTSSIYPTTASSVISNSTLKNNNSDEIVSEVKQTSTQLTNIVSSSEKDLGDICEGEITKIKPENVKETSINEVKFITSSNFENVKLSVSKLENKPEEISNIPVQENRTIQVYRYLDIKLTSNETYIGELGIESMSFNFSIEKSWIIEYNIDRDTIGMLRYHDGNWQRLNTTLITENETDLVFKAETPGLSTFAVVGSEIVEVSASYVEEVPEIPWILNLAIIITSSAILIFILFRSRYIYFDEKSDEQVKNKIDSKPKIDND